MSNLCTPMGDSFPKEFGGKIIFTPLQSGTCVVDIDTGLMICNATNISSWVSLTVSGQPSERQLINCWIRAPPLGGGGHVTYRLTVYTRLSLGAEFFFRLS